MGRSSDNTLGVVQFMHPGKEQSRHRKGWCGWNMAVRSDGAWPHRRKFIISNASYLKNGREEDGVVGFWGEWEGPSKVMWESKENDGRKPKVFHVPAYYEPGSYEGKLDTDPFVFGDRFLYCGCQQHTSHNNPGGAAETFLRRLGAGSLILYGSSVNKRFALDTVFVVGDFVDYPIGVFDDLRGRVPDEYYALSLHPQTLGNATCDSFRLYFGATLESPTGGMFSFTPCRPFKGPSTGFARPPIKLPGVITQNLMQGKKLTVMGDLREVKGVWEEVVRQLEGRYALAYRVSLNPIPVEVSE